MKSSTIIENSWNKKEAEQEITEKNNFKVNQDSKKRGLEMRAGFLIKAWVIQDANSGQQKTTAQR